MKELEYLFEAVPDCRFATRSYLNALTKFTRKIPFKKLPLYVNLMGVHPFKGEELVATDIKALVTYRLEAGK